MTQTREIEKNGLKLFIISLIASGLNYLFQILSGRFLMSSDYGALGAVFSVINIFTVAGSAMALSIAKFVAERSGQEKNISLVFSKSIKLYSIFLIIVSTATFIVMKNVFAYGVWESLLTALVVLSTCFASYTYGAIQGIKDFTAVGIYTLITPIVKCLCGSVLLYFGMPYRAVLYTMIVGSILSIIYNTFVLNKNGIKLNFSDLQTDKSIFKFFGFSFISSVCLIVFNNIDVLFVKYFFDDSLLGQYNVASLFGKIILYIPTALTVVMFPMVAQNKNNSSSILNKTLLYSGLLSIVAGTGLYIFKKPLILFLMGSQYEGAINYILPVCIMIIPLVFVTVMVNYLLAKGDVLLVSGACLFFTILIFTFMVLFHANITAVIYMLAISYFLLFNILYFSAQKEGLKNENK